MIDSSRKCPWYNMTDSKKTESGILGTQLENTRSSWASPPHLHPSFSRSLSHVKKEGPCVKISNVHGIIPKNNFSFPISSCKDEHNKHGITHHFALEAEKNLTVVPGFALYKQRRTNMECMTNHRVQPRHEKGKSISPFSNKG